MTRRTSFLFVHSSDEMYGADRMVLEMLHSLPDGLRARAEVWLPSDVEHGANPLCRVLERESIPFRHLNLPVLRRAYANPRGLARLSVQAAGILTRLRQTAPETVYLTTSATFLVAPAARLAGVQNVVGHLQEIWTPGDARLLVPPARAVGRLLAISSAARDAVPPTLRERVTVVPNGTQEPDGWAPVPSAPAPLTYAVASRWNSWKGHRTLLRAWDLAPGAGHLMVLGGPPPSGDAVDVVTLVAELREPASVTVVGEVPDASDRLADADVVVVPSDKPEPFGLVAIEAFARGRPVVGSAAGGLADIVTHGVDGWLYPPGDAEALARILRSLTRAEARTAGERARETYERLFTLDGFRARWLAAVDPRT